mmetsp:Transcript_68563/g.222126  ORF Transcript_68563/g.222126 Transcript_68563/m.222126 type:complete len:225 (+) Transcript_68563:222-896(+)
MPPLSAAAPLPGPAQSSNRSRTQHRDEPGTKREAIHLNCCSWVAEIDAQRDRQHADERRDQVRQKTKSSADTLLLTQILAAQILDGGDAEPAYSPIAAMVFDGIHLTNLMQHPHLPTAQLHSQGLESVVDLAARALIVGPAPVPRGGDAAEEPMLGSGLGAPGGATFAATTRGVELPSERRHAELALLQGPPQLRDAPRAALPPQPQCRRRSVSVHGLLHGLSE